MDSGAQDERIGRRRAALPRRSRPRARFAEVGGEALPDYELLELVLFRSIPRRDVKPAAKELVRRFGSFAEVLSAPVHRLVAVDGVGESVASDLKIVEAQPDSWRRAPSSSVRCWPPGRRSSITAVRPWPSASEQFRLLFLDKRNALIADEVQQTGTVDHTPVYPREVVRRALELSATALESFRFTRTHSLS
jgi:DNA repair protein RadC